MFGSEKYESFYSRIRYLIRQKSVITYIFPHYIAKINIDSYDSLPIEKKLTLHNVTIHIKSVINKDKNHYYYKFFLEKCSYELAKKQPQIFINSIIMVKLGDREIAKEKFHASKRSIKIWDVNVNNIVISYLKIS